MRPSFGPLARPRARIRPPPRRGFAAAPRLPAPSFRLHLALARLAPADARLRSSGAGLPVPRRLEDLSIPSALQGGVASFVDFCNHFSSDPRAQPSNRPIPADSISCVSMSLFCGPAGLELFRRPKPSPISRACHRAAAIESGAGRVAFAMHQRCRCASGAFARSSPQLHSYPDFDVCTHLSSQSTWRVVELETPILAGAHG